MIEREPMKFQKWLAKAVERLFEEGFSNDAARLNQVLIAMESLVAADNEYDHAKRGMYLAEGKPVYQLCVKRFEDACALRRSILDELKLEPRP